MTETLISEEPPTKLWQPTKEPVNGIFYDPIKE